jgi:hypothetical protein
VDVFELRDDLTEAYGEYATNFMRIRDERIDWMRRLGGRTAETDAA